MRFKDSDPLNAQVKQVPNDLTPFQRQCEAKLTAETAALGERLTDSDVYIGPSRMDDADVIVDARIGELRVWIYKDEAFVEAPDGRRAFERPDYDSEQSLVDAFVRYVVTVLKARR